MARNGGLDLSPVVGYSLSKQIRVINEMGMLTHLSPLAQNRARGQDGNAYTLEMIYLKWGDLVKNLNL